MQVSKEIENINCKFPKSQRLHHRNLVNRLFEGGETKYAHPLRMTYKISTEEEILQVFSNSIPADISQLQMMVTVPKKKFRHAVDRVFLRRRIREAYRLNRAELQQAVANCQRKIYLSVSFIYIGDKKLQYADIETKMKALLNKLTLTVTHQNQAEE